MTARAQWDELFGEGSGTPAEFGEIAREARRE